MSRYIAHRPDYFLVWTIVFLIFLGLLMLFTASSWLSLENTNGGEKNAIYYLFHQIIYGLLPGIILGYFFFRLPLDILKKIAAIFLALGIALLCLVFIPKFSFESGGATSWIGFGDFTFQPAEFTKLFLCIYLAAFFEKKIKEKKLKSFDEGFLPFLIILFPFALLLFLQPDFGTLGIVALISLSIFFSAGGSFTHILISIFLGFLILTVGILVFGHANERITTFLNPGKDTLGEGYQVNQSLIALGSGGVFGVGLGNGIQKYNYLPEPMGDTIFAVWGEETGFAGCSFIIFLFLMLGYKGIKIAQNAPDMFSRILAIGIISWLEIQGIINIMAVSGLIPFTGLPLPFISYGGSSLIAVLTAVGILINISRRTV